MAAKEKRTTFTMNMTETQKKLLDILAYYNHGEFGTRTHTVMELIRDDLKRFIDCPEEVELSDEALLEHASKQYDEDMAIKRYEQEQLRKHWINKIEGAKGGKDSE